ncbi:hypothetical protein [Algoriphagus sediminis]|uniref:Tetratricopeptide repeat protein n=1 Tax=Algoriphagus sediminis TaxID=3057113 RepID=A0ABT7YAF0_9BACT|nr:hypothetical protein [Algoriphagus sediminis]MDN3203411.1 hypothetical protein [Algoriphagus sediminis]
MLKKLGNSFGNGESVFLLFFLIGGLLAFLYTFLFSSAEYAVFSPYLFTDTIAVPFATLDLSGLEIPIEVDNFLIFQEFKALPPLKRVFESQAFGILLSLIAITGFSYFISLQRLYFVAGGALWIILTTLGNFNGLNIGGPSSNFALIILLSGTILPMIGIYIWKPMLAFWKRWLIIALGFILAWITLTLLSPVPNPELFLSQHLLVPAIGFSLMWLFWSGPAVMNGVYVLLAKANQSLGLKISIQLVLIAIVYLTLLFNSLLQITGDSTLPIPSINPLLVIPIIGFFGWIGIKNKVETNPEISDYPNVVKALYLLGLSLVFWTIWKINMASNEPAAEFIKHVTLYSQIAFSIFFLVYLYSNFLSVMDSGKAVEKIIYKPYSLPFYHVRIGGLIGMMVLIIYADGIIGVQVNSLSNNILGDYYYESDQKLEASILYENSWFRYRRNDKAKQATAQILFELNQPTLAKRHLEESFAENPQVDNILLLADRLHLENKPLEAVYYLENGLAYFPNSSKIANSLALFYTKIGRSEEAIAILQDFDDEVSFSNLMSLKAKAGELDLEDWENAKALIHQINSIPYQRLKGGNLDSNTADELALLAEDTNNPIIIQSALRNIFSQKTSSEIEKDIKLLDSLTRNPGYQDYILDLQETASIRSLGAQRVAESVKNLKGLAFRNSGDAAYYLQLSADILAYQLDFEKAAIDLLEAIGKGFQNIQPYHLDILKLAEEEAEAEKLALEYGLNTKDTLNAELLIWKNFHELTPSKAFDRWENIEAKALKSDFGQRVLMHKSHGLSDAQVSRIGNQILESSGPNDFLREFISNPDFSNQDQLILFMSWLEMGEELSANPYLTPLIFAAADRVPDSLERYNLLNSASEFNKDPVLWAAKADAARKVGLPNYATATLEEMKEWVSETDLIRLQSINF